MAYTKIWILLNFYENEYLYVFRFAYSEFGFRIWKFKTNYLKPI